MKRECIETVKFEVEATYNYTKRKVRRLVVTKSVLVDDIKSLLPENLKDSTVLTVFNERNKFPYMIDSGETHIARLIVDDNFVIRAIQYHPFIGFNEDFHKKISMKYIGSKIVGIKEYMYK